MKNDEKRAKTGRKSIRKRWSPGAQQLVENTQEDKEMPAPPNRSASSDSRAPVPESRVQSPERKKESQLSLAKERSNGKDPLDLPGFCDRTEIGQAWRAWNETAEAHGLPKAQKLTAARRAKLKARLRDAGGIEGWKTACAKVAKIPWMCGDNDMGGWKANLDYVLRESTFVKLMEGAHDRDPAGSDGEIPAAIRAAQAIAET